MFLETLEAVGTFLGGVGALAGGVAQLLTHLKKEEGDGGEAAGPMCDGPYSDRWLLLPV
ncbi:hypothetical protein [Streptomyces sp. ODS28]|uniref:hypothetical protein n=1 Tax=Streptomyces sp. ODS28 TaxID=3136688 RepID=UPI0031EFEC85